MKPQVLIRWGRNHLLIGLLLISLTGIALAQSSTIFTYQGRLTDNGSPANGNYDLQFKLYDALTGGTLIGTRTRTNVPVTGGVFTVQLDFAVGAFGGPDRFLEIGVRTLGSPDPFTTLDPRQPITSTPFAFHSLTSGVADAAANANQLGGVNASQYVLTTDPRMTDARPPAAGSTNYIENSTNPQAAAFNITGNGTAGGTLSATTVNAITQYNIGGSRILSAPGTFNLFAGASAGLLNSGTNNSFFGRSAGFINTTGSFNSFFGSSAGDTNTTGGNNSFFGYQAGQSNTSGADNAFFGVVAGGTNSTGLRNSFFGGGAGFSNTTANNNSFFGNAAGYNNEDGGNNVFVGYAAGFNNSIGAGNTFIGANTGGNIFSGNGNTFVGQNANSSLNNLTNATAIGANAVVGSSHTLVLGTNAVTVQVPGNLSVNGLLTGNLPGGDGSYIQNRTSQQSNASFNISGNGKVGGTLTANSVSASSVDASSVFASSLIGATVYQIDGDDVLRRNTLGHTWISSISGFVNVSGTLVAEGLLSAGGLHVNGAATVFGDLIITARTKVTPVISGVDDLCTTSDRYIAICSSSLRYKTDVQPFTSGLDVVRRLRPISFSWRNGGRNDVGFGAEDVNAVEPLLVTHNQDGQIEGVKYKQITTVLVNATKEQQEQIRQQQTQISELNEQLKKQQGQIETLKNLVCGLNPTAEPCRK